MRKPLLILVLALLAPAAAAAASASAGPMRGVFVGRVGGTQAFVAVAVGHGRARAYVCDSGRLAVWFPAGALHEGRAELHAGGTRLAVRLTGDGVRGRVTLADGGVHGFGAVRAVGSAGLYRAVKTVRGARYLVGWILLRGGAQRGEIIKVNHLNINTADEAQAAPKLNPEAASVQLAGAGTASVVKLGDSFIAKTTTG